MYCEIEQYEKVIEELIKGLAQKNPKSVAACVNSMTDCLKAFGAKVIKVSPLLKAVVPLLDHRDQPVREGGKHLVVEAYRSVVTTKLCSRTAGKVKTNLCRFVTFLTSV
jgi:cytoskeleton-associated protein 5